MDSAFPKLTPFFVKLDAVLAAVNRVGTSDEAAHAEEIQKDLETIASATNELRNRASRLAEGNPDGWDASKMRHDLRTPLNHIIGYGEILLQEANDVGAVAILSDLSRIVRGGKEILADIDDLVKEIIDPNRAPPPTPIGVTRMTSPSVSVFSAPVARITGRVLVVDDNEGNRVLLARRLERGGHNVSTAFDGANAIDMLERHSFDLVLLDVIMPRLTGVEVLTIMKRDPVLLQIPVIMISGLNDMDRIIECIQLGADDYLPKPFNPTLLQARIGACLQKKQLIDRQIDYVEQIELEKQRANALLRVILPEPVVAELQATDTVLPRRYENVAVLFCDIVGFTAYCEQHEPEEVLANLQKLVEAYEGLMGLYKMQKIKTIGDSFMAAAGLLDPVENPVLQCVRCGRDMIRLARDLQTTWGVRVGIAIGPVVAGVLGRQQYQFDLWGDTVNTAARVEGRGEENAVCLSGEAWERIGALPGVTGRSLGSVQMKGKGLVPLFRVERVDSEMIGME